MKKIFAFPFLVMACALLTACGQDFEESLVVTATGYTSSKRETQGDPLITAWGHKLDPEMKCIAVSRDLIPLGLTNGVKVKIEGFDDLYTVNDKMNRRWKKRIDIYFGYDKDAAKDWGKKKLEIQWNPPDESS